MDFMKVLDQTVREIKREVNIKVLKVPEIEQKVLDTTSDEPWGPHGTDLTEIAQGTKKFTECQLIMTTLWTRLGDGSRSWRHVYKALSVIEYLVAHGSERAVDDIIEHTFQISSLSGFELVEPNGKDVGINIRKKAETITGLLSNKDKIQEVRDKAAANRDKYFGLSSTGITYKSSIASTGFGSSSFQPSDRYGGASKKEEDTFKDSYRDRAHSGRDRYKKDSRGEGNNSRKASSHYHSRSEDASLSNTSNAPSELDNSHDKHGTIPTETSGAQESLEDDFDDFDPRGISTAGAAATNVNEVNLLDLMDAPATSVPEMSTTNGNETKEVDLFADAAFVSAPSKVGAGSSYHSQVTVPEMSPTNSSAINQVDLFADAAFVSAPPNVGAGGDFQSQAKADLFTSQPTFTSSSSSTVDLFSVPHTPAQSEFKSPKTETISTQAADPFASMPLNNFDGTDLFGAFTSQTDQGSAEPIQNSAKGAGLNTTIPNPLAEMKPSTKKNSFQVKSGIWADSLSRGIIDLNITAPKKADLTDLGIVGGLGDGSDENQKGPPATMYMGRAMGTGSGLGRSASAGFNSATAEIPDDFFSSLGQQNQFGSFQK